MQPIAKDLARNDFFFVRFKFCVFSQRFPFVVKHLLPLLLSEVGVLSCILDASPEDH